MNEKLFIETGECAEYDVTFPECSAGQRLDTAIAELLPEISRNRAQSLIDEGFVTLNGGRAVTQKSAKVKLGDTAHISAPVRIPLRAAPEDIELSVRYEDGDVIVVDKPKGMVVHPAPGNETGTLVNALLYRAHADGRKLPVIGGEVRPGIVHRIDKNTSGLIVAAKTDAAHRELSRQFAEHSVMREYTAIAVGGFGDDEGAIYCPTGRDPADRKKQKALSVLDEGMAPPSGFRRAVTRWRVLERIGGHTLLALWLETGRTHQIRVHLAHIGRPVLGDDLYGPSRTVASNRRKGESQYLHAGTLAFTHPTSGERMAFTSSLPEYFEGKLSELRRRAGRA